MNKTHQKTLAAVFASPVQSSLEWRRIEQLFLAAGAQVIEGNGSRVRFELHRKRPSLTKFEMQKTFFYSVEYAHEPDDL